MSVTSQIIEALDEISEPSIFEKYRAILKDNKKLKRNDWLNFRKLMKTDFIYEVLQMDLTTREARIVGNCIASISLKNPRGVLEAIIKKDDENTPILLEALLHKRKKFDVMPAQAYLAQMALNLTQSKYKAKLIHLHLLHTAFKNYPQLIEKNVLDFCSQNPHEICQEILSNFEVST